MSKRIEVRICTGTACYVQGGSYLLDLENHLGDRENEQIDIRGIGCLGLCGGISEKRPPFVTVAGETYGGLDLEGLLERVRTRLAEEERHE